MKLMIIGHGRHGKDTVCELLSSRYGLTFKSSSEVAAKEVVYPILKDKYNYTKFDVYCGIIDKEEFNALKDACVFDYSIWVDASLRLPPEDLSSMKLTQDDADFILNNNSSEERLKANLDSLMHNIKVYHSKFGNRNVKIQ